MNRKVNDVSSEGSGSSLSPLFRRVPAPVVASPLESHASYSPLPTSAHHASLLPFHRYTPATRVKRGRWRSADVESEEGRKCGEEERHRGTT